MAGSDIVPTTNEWRYLPAIRKYVQPTGILAIAGTLAALGLVLGELRHQGMAPLALLGQGGFAFWAAFVASLFVEPIAGYCILRHLLGTGRETLPPLLHKQSLNALLFGYAGDTFFLTWLQKHIGNARTAFGVVCNMAIASALVNNVATMAMLLMLWRPLQALAGARMDGWIALLAAGLVAIPLVLAGLRHKAMRGAGMATILSFLGLRTVVASLLVIATWYFALPAVPLSSWLLLMTGRMVVSRLPIVPNKDLAFAGCVSLFLSGDERIVPLVAGIALLTLAAQAMLIVLAYAASWSFDRWMRYQPAI